MRNPLTRRIPRELKSEFGKYLVIFLFLIGSIGIISGYLVAGDSMKTSNEASKEKFKVEDGNFELYFEGSEELIDSIEDKGEIEVHENFYINAFSEEEDATFRIYTNRTEIDLAEVLEGELPGNENEIAISRTFANNEANNLKIGDTIKIKDVTYIISGFVSMSDYTTQFEKSTDMMFDSARFTASLVTEEGFKRLSEDDIHYNYSYFYNEAPVDDNKASSMAEDLITVINDEATNSYNAVTGFCPAFSNQAIIFAPDDISGDKTAIEVLGYIIVILIAFIFSITINNTITREAQVIGTLRASGYSKSEITLHYMICPMLVVICGCIVGNILGYTYFKDFAASLYYNSYDLPKFNVLWNMTAFIKTTVIPFFICLFINYFAIARKLRLSPLRFLRKDISTTARRKAPKLSSKIGIMSRFRTRIILQNMANYITIFVGILLATVFVVFGLIMEPLMDIYAENISDNMIADYQYVMKAPHETSSDIAEKVTVTSYKTDFDLKVEEEVSFYGVTDNSSYIDLNMSSLKSHEIYISTALSEKYHVKVGDTISFKECYGNKTYEYKVKGLYEYPAICAVFMPREELNNILDKESDYYNGYFSNEELDDIDEIYIAGKITVDDMTKVSRQLTHSMSGIMKLVSVFGILTYMLVIFLLAKIIIEKNANSISMTKILGYYNGEINRLYIMSTTIVVIISLILSVPITNIAIKYIWEYMMRDYSGWFAYTTPWMSLLDSFGLGIVSYTLIAFILYRKVKKTPMLNALKSLE